MFLGFVFVYGCCSEFFVFVFGLLVGCCALIGGCVDLVFRCGCFMWGLAVGCLLGFICLRVGVAVLGSLAGWIFGSVCCVVVSFGGVFGCRVVGLF